MTISLAQNLLERRANAWEQAKSLLDGAEGRELSAEESESFDRIDADIRSLDERIKQITDAEERESDLAAAMSRINAAPEVREEAPTVNALRAFLNGETRGFHAEMSAAEFRVNSKLSAGAGAATVPTSFSGSLVSHLIETAAVIGGGATVLNTNSGETIQVPVTTGHSTAALTAEASAISASDPAFAQRSLGAYKYGVLIQLSKELLADSGVDIEGYIAMEAGRAVGNALGAHLVTGTGSSQPAGVITGASAGITGGTSVSGAFTADNLIDLFYSVISPYRNSPAASWLMRDATVGAVRKLKDSQNQYLWQPSLVIGAPDTLLGKAIVTDPGVAAVGLSAKSVAFGDLSRYYVRMVNGVELSRSDDFAFSSDLSTFKVTVRADGILADQTGAVKLFAGGAS